MRKKSSSGAVPQGSSIKDPDVADTSLDRNSKILLGIFAVLLISLIATAVYQRVIVSSGSNHLADPVVVAQPESELPEGVMNVLIDVLAEAEEEAEKIEASRTAEPVPQQERNKASCIILANQYDDHIIGFALANGCSTRIVEFLRYPQVCDSISGTCSTL